MNLQAKQDIRMGRKGLIIPKGTPFMWSPRTKYYVAKIDNQIVASVSPQYVQKVNIFESL